VDVEANNPSGLKKKPGAQLGLYLGENNRVCYPGHPASQRNEKTVVLGKSRTASGPHGRGSFGGGRLVFTEDSPRHRKAQKPPSIRGEEVFPRKKLVYTTDWALGKRKTPLKKKTPPA